MSSSKTSRRRTAVIGLAAAFAVVLGACSGSSTTGTGTTSSAGGASSTPGSSAGGSATTAVAQPLKILVTNDDGYQAEGISVAVQQLQTLPNVEITVVAPATNQSGKSDATTPNSPAGLTTVEGTTQAGYKALGVEGTPADSVLYALETLGLQPDLVVSGINAGQNVGPLVDISGTVGAARTAARRGIPALAASQSISGEEVAEGTLFTNAGVLTKDWVAANRERILREEHGTGTVPAPAKVVAINVPNCGAAPVRGVVEVPTATDFAGRSVDANDCASTKPSPADDVDAIATGYASQSEVALEKATR